MHWVETVSSSKGGKDVVKALADRLDIPEEEIWSGKSLQLSGQQLIEEKFSNKDQAIQEYDKAALAERQQKAFKGRNRDR